MSLPGYAIGNVDAPLSAVVVRTNSGLHKEVVFNYRLPKLLKPSGILILVPGFNGDGAVYLRSREWTEFADRENLLLVGPSFQTDLSEIQARKGYYYPALWSGKATLDALEKIQAIAGVKIGKVFLFGFSAGAHFVHGFAQWNPAKVAGFVAYSAAWWQKPSAALRSVPGLILCGEDDERYDPSLAYYKEGHTLDLPWIWRGYPGVGHEVTQSVVAMAQAFIHHYSSREKTENWIGDSQSYECYQESTEEANNIPEELRVALPSPVLAEAWKKE